MVFISRFLRKMPENVKKIRKHFKSKFLDCLRLHVKGGAGGMGFPKYGGIGGAGGNIYIEAKEGTTMEDILKAFRLKKVKAEPGNNSSSRCILGRSGANTIVTAPLGITVYNELGKKLGDLNEEGQQILVAKGGSGGCLENGFCGTRGQNQVIKIDLKLIADVGFVGFPNAGKSTLLSKLSRSKPKIASYPFTTIKPNIGIMEFPDLRKISLADLPGLIEGAHVNIGMGHSFLRHVERTKLLLLIADIGGFRLSPKHMLRNCLETIVLLNKELELYKEELLDKPAILIINKMDVDGAQEMYKEIEHSVQNLADVIPDFETSVQPKKPIQFTDILKISAKNGDDKEIENVKQTIRRTLDLSLEDKIAETETELLKKLENSITEKGPILV
uniref:OBG-type G domain-containing protein n=2 Tax=Clastoptera arizonana TaxID=38151 RepID=A0A1B6CW52_9HEMI